MYGYSPRTALDRLRVARELGQLPEMEAALRDGEISYAAARELSRVMTPQTEAAWLTAARGKNTRDIADMVSGRKKGDSPDAPKQPELVERVVTLRLTPAIDALLRLTRANLSDECGMHLDDSAFIEIMCRRSSAGHAACTDDMKGAGSPSTDVDRAGAAPLGRGSPSTDIDGACAHRSCSHSVARSRSAGVPRPAYQISIRKCDACSHGSQLGGGTWVPIDDATLAMAECDAVLLGDEELLGNRREHGSKRVSTTIPKKVRERVWLRDGGRCRVPGCRATRNCDLHHLQFRSHGGDHDPSNLIVLCSGHHKLLHDGLLTITGRDPDELAFVRDGRPLVDSRRPAEVAACTELRSSNSARIRQRATPVGAASRFAGIVVLSEAKAALRRLGYKPRAAKQALDRACARAGASADAAALVKAVLAMDREQPSTDSLVDHEYELKRLAKQAIVQSGYDASTAKRAVDAAAIRLGPDAELAELLRDAFRCCGS